MNNTLRKSSRERGQRLYDKNAEVESKLRKAAQARVPSDPSVWQQMREILEMILVEHQDFFEQRDIEFALWQLHYKRIKDLRAHLTAAQASAAQNRKGTARPGPDRITKIQDPQNDVSLSRGGEKSIDMKKGLLSCHQCFIYLGDLARYKGLYGDGASNLRDFATAASYYKQAATLCPLGGNPDPLIPTVIALVGSTDCLLSENQEMVLATLFARLLSNGNWKVMVNTDLMLVHVDISIDP
ncbi:protein SMG7 [Tanacetum coccineum]